MLLFQKRFHEGLVSQAITLTFRRWARAMVKAGVRYRCHPIGVLLVDGVETVRVSEITDHDARRSGFSDREQLTAYLASGPGGELRADEAIFRITLHHVGDEDAKPLAFDAEISEEEARVVQEKLKRLDAKGKPWTRKTLELIAAHPRRRAGDLADMLGRARLDFKADVRKLKALGLTISHEVGYTLSPRGARYLELVGAKAP
ncbi:MAG: hypothetical protein FJX76_14205 [Armatimonadetes bacterium]|nr:hypothetical protein [Armatimonadota bacterium]